MDTATLPQIVKWHRSARPVDAVLLVVAASVWPEVEKC